MQPINYLDGFSGYGGFHLGLERGGFQFSNVYYSEIDKYAIANYSYNFKDSIYAGSIDTICEGGIVKDIDFFTFGWPCQDNSIAGKRKGQRAGTRSGLLFESIKILNHFKPRHFIAENVLGLLSVNKGIDIIESLEVLAYLNESCPQYDIEVQLLNTRWLLPQNRERLYFVGHLRGRGGRKIFPIGEGTEQINEKQIQVGFRTDIAPALTVSMSEGARRDFASSHVIRDLTNIEYERAQGLPDNWTQYGVFDGKVKEISKGKRYKLCGNGVSVPVVESIAKRLIENYDK